MICVAGRSPASCGLRVAIDGSFQVVILPSKILSMTAGPRIRLVILWSVLAVQVVHEGQTGRDVGEVLIRLVRSLFRLVGAIGDVRGGEVDLIERERIQPDDRRGDLPVDVESEQGARRTDPQLHGHDREAGAGCVEAGKAVRRHRKRGGRRRAGATLLVARTVKV